MIGFLRGTVLNVDRSELIVEAGQSGVGYRICLAAPEAAMPAPGEAVELHIYTQVREDAIELYGFRTRDERTLFTLLISVKGIGAKVAVSLLSMLSPGEVQVAVLTGNVALLKKVPGIGAKVAQRLVLELQEALKAYHFADAIPETSARPVPVAAHADTRSALRNFGFSESDIDKVLERLDASGESLDVQGEIRWALKNMKS
ncbi:MAG: Holliday junction branch migration protein RuvA [Proteobacteria bacterium]|nr:Holliday junction branch migration protein RuvA [Pseudomonadota bacterium]